MVPMLTQKRTPSTEGLHLTSWKIRNVGVRDIDGPSLFGTSCNTGYDLCRFRAHEWKPAVDDVGFRIQECFGMWCVAVGGSVAGAGMLTRRMWVRTSRSTGMEWVSLWDGPCHIKQSIRVSCPLWSVATARHTHTRKHTSLGPVVACEFCHHRPSPPVWLPPASPSLFGCACMIQLLVFTFCGSDRPGDPLKPFRCQAGSRVSRRADLLGKELRAARWRNPSSARPFLSGCSSSLLFTLREYCPGDSVS